MLLGGRASERRTLCRAVYSRHTKTVRRGATSLKVPPLYSPFPPKGPLKLTEDLVNILSNSSTLTPPNTPPPTPRRIQQRHSITPTMSDDTKKKEQITLPTWDQLVQWNHYHAVSLDNASLNPKGVLGYSYEVKVGTTGSLYTRKGGLLIPASSATVANLMDPTIVANGRVIRTSEPVVDGLIAGARTYGGNKKGDKLLDMALESSLGKGKQLCIPKSALTLHVFISSISHTHTTLSILCCIMKMNKGIKRLICAWVHLMTPLPSFIKMLSLKGVPSRVFLCVTIFISYPPTSLPRMLALIQSPRRKLMRT